MAILDRRVQVLFDAEEFGLVQALAMRQGLSVGAVIRQSVRTTLRNPDSRREEALTRLLERADATPTESITDWQVVKDGFEREYLEAIG